MVGLEGLRSHTSRYVEFHIVFFAEIRTIPNIEVAAPDAGGHCPLKPTVNSSQPPRNCLPCPSYRPGSYTFRGHA